MRLCNCIYIFLINKVFFPNPFLYFRKISGGSGSSEAPCDWSTSPDCGKRGTSFWPRMTLTLTNSYVQLYREENGE